MIKSLVSFKGMAGLAERVSPQEHAGEALLTNLPSLVIDPANLPRTAKQLAANLARAHNLFERGSEVVRIVTTCEGARIEHLNPQIVVIAAHEVCQPVEDKTTRGEIVREKITSGGVASFISISERILACRSEGICARPLR
jgi:hypothetical protein